LKTNIYRLTAICFALFLNSSSISATHIRGSELYFSESSTYNYNLTLKVFRDCRECKFNGNGGGNSTQNCQEIPPLILYGINQSNEWISLGNVNLTRDKINNISTNCASVRNSCQNQGNIGYGMEEHILKSTINLSQHVSSGYCKFRFGLAVQSRSTDIVPSGTPTPAFFNYSELNLCNGTFLKNSVSFDNQPFFYTELNTLFQYSPGINYPKGDSVSVKLVKALTGPHSNLTYKISRSENNPLSFNTNINYPGTDINGIYFDQITGNTVFTPDMNQETGVWVMEFTQWRKNNQGVWKEVAVFRRDFQTEVINASNQTPKIGQTQHIYTACEGEELCFNIPVSDSWQGTSSGDTVKLVRKSGSFGHLSIVNTNNSPVESGRFCWTPNSNDVSNHPYMLTVEAKDNNCPLVGISQLTYLIHVVKKPEVQIRKRMQNCGDFSLEAVTSDPISSNQFKWEITFPDNQKVNTSGKTINLQYKKGGIVNIKLLVEGSNCFKPISDSLLLPEFKNPDFTLPNPEYVCADKNFEIKPQIISLEQPATYIWSDQSSNLNWNGKISSTTNFTLIIRDKNNCQASQSIKIQTFEKPKINAPDTGFCSTDQGFINLSKIISFDHSKLNDIQFYKLNSGYDIFKTDSGYVLDKSTMMTNKAIIRVVIIDLNQCEQSDTFNILSITPPEIPEGFWSHFCENEISTNIFQLFNINNQSGHFEYTHSGEIIHDGIIKREMFNNNPELKLKFISKPHLCGKVFDLTFHLTNLPIPNILIDNVTEICKNSNSITLSPNFDKGKWTGVGINGHIFDPDLPEILPGKNYLISYFLKDESTECSYNREFLVKVKDYAAITINSISDSFCASEKVIQMYVLIDNQIALNSNPTINVTGGKANFDNSSGTIKFEHNDIHGWKNINVEYEFLCTETNPSKKIHISSIPEGIIYSELKTHCSPNAIIELVPVLENTKTVQWLVNNIIIPTAPNNPALKIQYTTAESGTYRFSLLAKNGKCFSEIKLPNQMIIHPAPEPIINSNPNKAVPVDFREVRFKDVGTYVHNPVQRTWIIEGVRSGNLDSAIYRVRKEEGEIMVELYVVDSMGCEGYSSHLMHISTPLDLFIPNAFSPNGTGPDLNNVFKVNVSEAEFFSMSIFNRWGEMVFQSNDPNRGWDGVSNEKPCLPGVYNYYIRVVNQLGGSREFKGSLILMR
jgi:gliding motility-associated-like protein